MSYLNSICFVCLGDETKFSTVCHNEIFTLVKYVLPELMRLDSENPITICSPCCTTLQSFHTFKKKCLENYSQWKHYTQNLQESNQTQIKIEDTNEDTCLSSEEQDESKTIIAKEEIFKSEDSSNPEFYQLFVKCEPASNDEQDGGSSITNPLDMDESNSQTDVDSQVLEGNKDNECIHCKKKFTTSSNLKAHIIRHEFIKDYECLICKKMFGRIVDLKIHSKIHEVIEDYECPICMKKFVRKNGLKSHVKLHESNTDHEDNKKYECLICNKKFGMKCDINRHLIIHEGTRDYQCLICKKLFGRKDALKRHLTIHEEIKDYECAICKKKFGRKNQLKRHVKVHKGNADRRVFKNTDRIKVNIHDDNKSVFNLQ